MSLNIIIHSALTAEVTNNVLDRIRADNTDLFDSAFLICRAHNPLPQKQRVLNELGIYNFNVESVFLVSINEKMRMSEAPKVVEIIRSYFGTDELIVLWENEELFDNMKF